MIVRQMQSDNSPVLPGQRLTNGTDLSPPQARRKSFPRRRQSRYYALTASRDQIILLRMQPLGYLHQSRLIQRAQAGDIEARKIVWLHNARMAYSVVNDVRPCTDLVADAIQEAQVGLCRAIRLFNVERLYLLSTYAFATMRRRVQRFRHGAAFAAHVPAYLHGEYARFHHRLERTHRPADWFDLRSAYLDRDPGLYSRLLRIHALARPHDISAAIDLPADDGRPEARLEAEEGIHALRSALRALDSRERLILARRYGLGGADPQTLLQIATALGLSRERVRQIQSDAERTLRHMLARRLGEPLPAEEAENRPGPARPILNGTGGTRSTPPPACGTQAVLPFPQSDASD